MCSNFEQPGAVLFLGLRLHSIGARTALRFLEILTHR
jgi:hypothetical protein